MLKPKIWGFEYLEVIQIRTNHRILCTSFMLADVCVTKIKNSK